MKKPKAMLAEGIATVLFTVIAFKRCREWRRRGKSAWGWLVNLEK